MAIGNLLPVLQALPVYYQTHQNFSDSLGAAECLVQ